MGPVGKEHIRDDVELSDWPACSLPPGVGGNHGDSWALLPRPDAPEHEFCPHPGSCTGEPRGRRPVQAWGREGPTWPGLQAVKGQGQGHRRGSEPDGVGGGGKGACLGSELSRHTPNMSRPTLSPTHRTLSPPELLLVLPEGRKHETNKHSHRGLTGSSTRRDPLCRSRGCQSPRLAMCFHHLFTIAYGD